MEGSYESSIFAPASIGQNKFFDPLCAWKTFSFAQLTLELSFKITSAAPSSSKVQTFFLMSQMFFHSFLVFLLSRSFKLFTHAPLDKLCLRLHRHFLPIVHLYDHTLFVQLSLVLPMKFLLRLLWAQNGFVNNQNHKHWRFGRMFLFTTS